MSIETKPRTVSFRRDDHDRLDDQARKLWNETKRMCLHRLVAVGMSGNPDGADDNFVSFTVTKDAVTVVYGD